MDKPETHDFLLNHEDELSAAAKEIPALRDAISELPKTAATFRVPDFDGVKHHVTDSIHVEFVKAWQIHPRYPNSQQTAQKYVNPNYAHAQTYTDVLAECECGAVINRNNDRNELALQGEHDHSDTCLPEYRLDARARAHAEKRQAILRLTRIGWHGNEISSRIGMTRDHIADLAREYHLSFEDLRDVYRTIAGNTYAYLVRENGETGSTVAEVYGHQRNTLSRWATEYSDFEPSRELVRNDDGLFEWQRVTEKPDFLQ